MSSAARTPEMAAAFDAASGGMGQLRSIGMAPVDGADARVVMRELEVLGRQVAALQVAVLGDVQRRGLHRHDGMASAKVMMRHCCKVSDEQARRWEMIRRALTDLPRVEGAYGDGRIGTGQVALIARVHGNVRVRSALVAEDEALVRLAERLSYLELACRLRNWERLVDADGTADKTARGHEQRDATCAQDLDGNWEGRWRCGPLEGARRRAILRAFMAAEFDADWAKARAALGDAATVADLLRTDAQRRSDAFDEIFRSAADHHGAPPAGRRSRPRS